MSAIRPGTCADPGPLDYHCTELPSHRYSHYDAGEDAAWNDGQFDDGWYDGMLHHCGDSTCDGRPGPVPYQQGVVGPT